jgi:hypothetical protein
MEKSTVSILDVLKLSLLVFVLLMLLLFSIANMESVEKTNQVLQEFADLSVSKANTAKTTFYCCGASQMTKE